MTYEIEIPYSFFGDNRAAYRCQDSEVMLAGPADTGKTLTLLTKLYHIAYKYPNANLVIARKQLTDTYSTVLQTFVKKVVRDDNRVMAYGGEKPQWFDFPNGSRIWIAGLDKPGKLLSGEFDWAYINQAEEASLVDWEVLGTRTTGRAGHTPYAQICGDCNPAGPTHWIKTRANAGTLTLFNSTHKDNPDLFDQETGQLTEQGMQRIGRLKSLTGARLMRLYHGLWVSPEGAIYSVFDEEKHKVRAFDIPPLWPRVVGIDPLGAYTAAVWGAFDNQANMLHIYREYYQPFGVTTAGHARAILNLSQGETIFAWAGGGPSERQQRVDFAGAGIPLLAPLVTDVWAGIDRVNQLLRDHALVIHDSCPQLLSEITDYRRKLKDGEPTDQIENKEQYHLCLVPGTLITTARGQIPIENIQVGELVLTRKGYSRALAAMQTSPLARVMTVYLSDGRAITGTPNHPIYVRNKGYTDLQALRYGDIMETSCNLEVFPWNRKEKKLSMMVASGIGILIRPIEQIGSIIATALAWKPMSICIGISGKSIMGQFQKAMQCIIRTATQTITPLRILSVSHALSICNGMGPTRQMNRLNRKDSTPNQSDRLPPSGTVHQRAVNGTALMASLRGKRESQSRNNASNVDNHSKHWPGTAIPSFAPITADQRQGGRLELTMRQGNVPDVEHPSWSINTQSSDIVPIHVLFVTGAPDRSVYNLTVEGGEYFANGILTHNCDSLRYLCAYLMGPQEQSEVVYKPVQIGPQW